MGDLERERYEESRRPRVFVGSSTEKLGIAEAVRSLLDDSRSEFPMSVTVWPDIFRLSRSNLSNLIKALDGFDFGVFVFATDDPIRIRHQSQRGTRDNVVFECGLFMGRLGPERTYFIMPGGDRTFRLPTDLLGISGASYSSNEAASDPESMVRDACDSIRREARALIVFVPDRDLAKRLHVV